MEIRNFSPYGPIRIFKYNILESYEGRYIVLQHIQEIRDRFYFKVTKCILIRTLPVSTVMVFCDNT